MPSKIEIRIPANNIEERRYIINCIFRNFLGLQVEIIIDEQSQGYMITFSDKMLIVTDAFFNKYPRLLAYLSENNLPSVGWAVNQFIVEKDIPIIYGTDELVISEDKIVCGIDIFASSFFMLTRWEEYVNGIKDNHERFPGVKSIAYKNNFLHRPVVNEYVEMLWNMLISLGFCGERKLRRYELVLTHDIDYLQYPKRKYFRALLGDIAKRRDLRTAEIRIKYLLGKDPFDKYDWLMDQSEKIGVKSHFYFMASTLISPLRDTEYYINKSKFKKTVTEIMRRGHEIGFHPGYYSYVDAEVWECEKNALEGAIAQPVKEGRQHYLRIEMPDTLNIWDKNNMEIDSSLGYADKEGFRCGTGDEFPVFDFLNREQMSLRERPLIVMEGTLCRGLNYSLEQIFSIYKYYIKVGKRYNSQLTLLFHNSSFESISWLGWEKLYIDILDNQ